MMAWRLEYAFYPDFGLKPHVVVWIDEPQGITGGWWRFDTSIFYKIFFTDCMLVAVRPG